MTLLLDTNRYSDAVAGDAAVDLVLRTAQRVYLPYVVLAELRFGFVSGNQATRNEQRLQQFLLTPNVETLWADDQTTHEYARLRNYLRQKGTPLPTDDIWIAALAVQHDLPLYTRDAHFDRLPQVKRV